jgi:hydrogenase maturation protease
LAADLGVSRAIDVIDAGTASLDLLAAIAGRAHVILVDAIRAGGEPGSVYAVEIDRDNLSDVEPTAPVSLHEWGLLDTLRTAARLDLLPRRVTLLGAEPGRIEPGTELSPDLARAAQRITALILSRARARDLEEDEPLAARSAETSSAAR